MNTINTEQYNSLDTLIAISLYPKKGELYSAGTSGIASFAKNTAIHMNRKVVVLAEYTDKPSMYEEDNTLVMRCFKKNSPTMWADLFKNLRKFNNAKNVLIQFDFALYGDMKTTLGFLPFLALLRVFSYRPSVVVHSIVTDVFDLSGHLGLENTPQDYVKGLVFNKIFRLFYRMLGVCSSNVIVAEELLKKKLSKFIAKRKIIAIPHGVDEHLKLVDKEKARQKLGIPQDEMVILFFGFVNWFKGADFFVDTFQKISKILGIKARFIIAGGASATLSQKEYYKRYFADSMYKIQNSKALEITGFVPQEKIGAYFGASDLVVFPYRTLMAASGVISLAFSYRKPFILSEELAPLFNESDFKAALDAVGLEKEKIIFEMNKQSCVSVAEKVLRNGLKMKTMKLAEIMRETRSWKKTGILYDKALFENNIAFTPSLQLNYAK